MKIIKQNMKACRAAVMALVILQFHRVKALFCRVPMACKVFAFNIDTHNYLSHKNQIL
jgi:hypothetical protein